ncbi:uncharacterized protein SPPG_08781 [Spizellomyces punctatus DAOM BR117]|uniref:Rho-GAP domain-containing protein n=1 Tax=Spizellomyces punctatus (strain DAOM BR117) TaxID=645134 RepID=A0A0L0H4Z2_SPIPD|nr:uncharacterized protein SPPG_08781 [Spizellomyces punctatus DAOM BR117]KNC95788.1 hypothetical protein SPPG_08781 [Spizellomyces punctatus DAOM BR117]|eukprot:XP_016603828.1 hypothetical protein SPPG_08781 [Spizellomyces punctatus DAOM BR117]
MEALEKENKEGVGNPKTLKLAKDITSAEQGYRRGIQDLEEIRQRFQLVREQTQKTCERVEWDRVLALKNALGTYTEAEGKLMKVGGEAVDRCSIFVECMSPQVDCHFFVADFMRIWPDATPMYYESYTHGIAKDMVFGVPLETLLRAHPGSGIPAVLYKCVRAVEARGLDKEGIYRVSGKHSDVLELKLRVEKDVHSVNLEDESWDVHVIAGLVKMYLRQLPVPVFPFPAKERTEYSQIADEKERVLRLRARVKALPRSHHTVLKFLAEHLAKYVFPYYCR